MYWLQCVVVGFRGASVQVRSMWPWVPPMGRPEVPLHLAALGCTPIPMRVLRKVVCAQVFTDRAPARAHWRAKLQVRVLRKGLPRFLLSSQPPPYSYWWLKLFQLFESFLYGTFLFNSFVFNSCDLFTFMMWNHIYDHIYYVILFIAVWSVIFLKTRWFLLMSMHS